MKKRILLADDDGSVRRMVGRVLESEQYDVLLAKNGIEAAAIAAAAAPDLIVLDVSLAEQTNGSLFEIMHRPGVPLIVLTARSRKSGPFALPPAAAILEKPLDVFALLSVVESLLAVRP